ncbi:hypothetical protein B0H63DRAFT_460514 [Podospora didyma]|uniref:Uncharacterized protein n=1 Tax=Podospora didyma TaxID=330526 RepID=A0AAE0P6L1_9PEZI|nr:hypothetical protein B0H63DRAFT_460514 [Podospora didyma]
MILRVSICWRTAATGFMCCLIVLRCFDLFDLGKNCPIKTQKRLTLASPRLSKGAQRPRSAQHKSQQRVSKSLFPI